MAFNDIKFSWNPFNMIPDTISYNLKVVLISLIVLQFLAFVVWMVIIVREYLQTKRDRENDKDLKKGKKKKK